MSNERVEELESTVAELESTVEGLTDELIEAKERIRVLEAELDAETPTRVPDRRVSDAAAEAEGETGVDATAEAEPDEVAEAAADAEADEESATADETEDSGSDDIIVA